jgi:signal transduction histidine kinase
VEGKPRKMGSWACEEICKIAREALRNAFLHARAQQIEVEILFAKRSLHVRVRDDGIGIAPAVLEAGLRAGHWGLVGMKERAEGLRGRLHVRSRPGAGTEIEVIIPRATAFRTDTSWFLREREHDEHA